MRLKLVDGIAVVKIPSGFSWMNLRRVAIEVSAWTARRYMMRDESLEVFEAMKTLHLHVCGWSINTKSQTRWKRAVWTIACACRIRKDMGEIESSRRKLPWNRKNGKYNGLMRLGSSTIDQRSVLVCIGCIIARDSVTDGTKSAKSLSSFR
jgi:hypothetical protein